MRIVTTIYRRAAAVALKSKGCNAWWLARLVLAAWIAVACDNKPAAVKAKGTDSTVPAGQAGGRNDPSYEAMSALEDNSRSGKDPFFPGSKRRMARMQTPSTNKDSHRVVETTLSVKGIIGSPGHRFAMINDKTF